MSGILRGVRSAQFAKEREPREREIHQQERKKIPFVRNYEGTHKQERSKKSKVVNARVGQRGALERTHGPGRLSPGAERDRGQYERKEDGADHGGGDEKCGGENARKTTRRMACVAFQLFTGR
jgi:hypothetical protein